MNMTSRELTPFKAGITKLSVVLKKHNHRVEDVNQILDELNALDFQKSFSGGENFENLVVECCTSIPPNNSLLVAKSSNLILNHVLRNKVVLPGDSLKSLLSWANEAFKHGSDVAYLDILHLIYFIIKNHPTFFREHGSSLVPFLFEKLESKASVLQPDDIILWRVYCIKSLTKCFLNHVTDCSAEINELCSILYLLKTDNLLFQTKIWGTVVKTLDELAPKGNPKVLKTKLNEIIGIIEVAATLGLVGKECATPKEVFPSLFFSQEISNVDLQPKIPPKVNQSTKKKQRNKAKKVNWVEKNEEEDHTDLKHMKGFEVYNLTNLTSDSDYSDIELGKTGQLHKEQAKTRHATFNLIIRLSNILKGRPLYGYYSVLLNVLMQSIRLESNSRTKVAALAAVGALLMHSKPLLAQAQHSEGTRFLGFSGSLSELLSSLHSCLGRCLSGAPPPPLLVPLLHTASSLISVSPYQRLRPTLLSSFLQTFHPYLKDKDPAVCVGAFKCLNEIAAINPSFNEQDDLLRRGAKQSKTSDVWVSSLILPYLEDDNTNVVIRVACWQLLGTLFKHHFELIEEKLSSFEDAIFIDLKSSNSETQLYTTYALNRLLEAIVGKAKFENYCQGLWLRLLKGPIVSLLQSPEVIACEACDCLANMGPIVFAALKEKEQILVVTLIFGCIDHEKATVRAAAVQTLGTFLLFPQMAHEQFLYDAKDLLLKALKDEAVIVRIKAAWATANLIDLVINSQDEETFGDFNLKNILLISIELAKDDDLVKANIVRAVGLLLSVLSEDDLAELDSTVLERSVQFLMKSSTSGSKMKMRWNACHAICTMLKNRCLLSYSEKWMGTLIQSLCNLIVSCNNFKVRANACSALCEIPSRNNFGPLYSFVWTSLMDGLDNAVNMPDFREYKHQHSLKQQLCIGICHMTRLLEEEDVAELESVLEMRLESLKEELCHFQRNTPPEQAASCIAAANNVQRLLSLSAAASRPHQHFLLKLKHLFTTPLS